MMRFSVCVNHGSTLDPSTALTDEARGAKAAAEAGSSCTGIVTGAGRGGGFWMVCVGGLCNRTRHAATTVATTRRRGRSKEQGERAAERLRAREGWVRMGKRIVIRNKVSK